MVAGTAWVFLYVMDYATQKIVDKNGPARGYVVGVTVVGGYIYFFI